MLAARLLAFAALSCALSHGFTIPRQVSIDSHVHLAAATADGGIPKPKPRRKVAAKPQEQQQQQQQQRQSSGQDNSEGRPRRTRSFLESSNNKLGYSRRSNGRKKFKSSTARRPPQWEKEGDSLYQAISVPQNEGMIPRTAQQARDILSKYDAPVEAEPSRAVQKPVVEEEEKTDSKPAFLSNMLWGTLSVGPILKQRLVEAGFKEPTPIQTAAYSAIVSKHRNNVLLASPTGSGKTLAYLIPLITNPEKGKRTPGMYLVFTPTVELAAQLKRHTLEFWGDESLMHVLMNAPDQDDENEDEDDETSKLRFLPQLTDAPIIAGTPKSMRGLFKEMRKVLTIRKKEAVAPAPVSELDGILAEMEATMGAGSVGQNGDDEDDTLKSKAQAIKSNLCAIVLDEADRLLRTEQVARAGERRIDPSVTELLLSRELPISISELQLIGASATVGRTLRRQIMNLVDASSMDAAAQLVTGEGDVRNRKDETRRRSSLIPSTLEHNYHIVEPLDGDYEKNERYRLESLDALQKVLRRDASTLVFPGRVGVGSVVDFLIENGFENVQTLSMDMSVPEDSKVPPIFVVGDKFGRGLDLPDVQYVVLMSPPSSAAGYTHLAGRTGRNGNPGTAITLLRSKEAPKLAAIAEALGLRLVEQGRDKETTNELENADDSSSISEWQELSEPALQRKTVAQICEFLDEQGVEYLDDDGKRPKKSDLVATIIEYLASS